MQVCPNCKNELADGKKFCNKCGTKLINPQPLSDNKDGICKICGAAIKDGQLFCNNCGASAFSAKPEIKAPVDNTIKCHNCGMTLTNNERFCSRCGAPVSSEAMQPPINLIDETIPAAKVNFDKKIDNFNKNINDEPPMMNPVPRQKKIPVIIPIILVLLIIGVLCVDVFWLFKDEVRDLLGLDKSESSSTSAQIIDNDYLFGTEGSTLFINMD